MTPNDKDEAMTDQTAPDIGELLSADERILSMLDLTDLSDECTRVDIERLCLEATDPHGHVAAVCVWPRWVARASELLGNTGVRVACVVNFPDPTMALDEVIAQVRAALDDGADEIDLVWPWPSFLAGDSFGPTAMVRAVKDLIGHRRTLKVILETGLYPDQGSINRAALLAVESGADFLKTSTGKKAVSATLEAVDTLLKVIREAPRPIGIKPSGGIRTVVEAQRFLDRADAVMGPRWATPDTFRIGASTLHRELINAIDAAGVAG
jgi:deoxyribose-phosphate aldolase